MASASIKSPFPPKRPHRKVWVELIPTHGMSIIHREDTEPEDILGGPIEHHQVYRFSTRDFDVIVHDKPSDNLRKLVEGGLHEITAIKALDILGLD